jgi:serine/threonine protein kinase
VIEGGGELLGQRLGGYQLESLLGSGGMAEVYRALDPHLNRLVAVKVLPRSLAADPNYVARFRDEARRVAALTHPHIVPVYHYGEERGLLYLVMPILRESLRDRLGREEGGRLPPAEAGRLAVEIASALEAAHERGLVHRDVKPENILLDGKGRALLTDFGIAREMAFLRRPGAAQTLASTGLPVGTPEYMAPEQLRGGAVDQRADIYGLGAVLYEMLTGVVPHEAETPYEVASLVLTAPLARPSVRNPGIRPALEAVVVRARAKRPWDRHADARGFAEALAEAIDEPASVAVPAVGAWPRKTRRFDASRLRDAEMPEDGGPTLPLAIVPGPLRKPLRSMRQRGRRVTLLAVAGVLLVSSLCGGSAVAVMNGFQPAWLARSQTVSLPTATATSIPLPTDTPLPTATRTPKPTATAAPQLTATSAPKPTATAVPRLTLVGTPILMTPATGTCYGTLRIQNNSPRTLGWSWQSISAPTSLWSYFAYSLDGGKSYTSFRVSPLRLPSNTSPGVATGATQVLALRVSDCAHKLPTTVTMTDTLGHTYTFAMQTSG